MPARVRAISLDLFDTLVDLHFDRLPHAEIRGRSTPSTLAAQHAVLTERGHDVALDRFASTLFDSDRELGASHWDQGLEIPTLLRFQRVAERLAIADADLPEALTRAHMGGIASIAKAPDHHHDTLGRLADRFRLGLCSNFSHAETALAILEREGLLRHFSAVAISETARFRKPRREIFAALLDELGLEPEEVVHVGDRLLDDVDGASAAGMRTVWLTRRVRDPEAALAGHMGARPTWKAADLSELLDLLADA
jgi:HAD superfamily hydrolase (TIGR01549 family)